MLRAALLVLLMAPTASAWAVRLDAPPEAGAGLPFLVEVCVEAPVAAERKVAFRDDRRARYAPLPKATCEDVTVHAPARAGETWLEAKARPAGGASKAAAVRPVRLVEAPFALPAASAPSALLDAEGRVLLRLPPHAPVPHLPGAAAWRAGNETLPLPALARFVLAEARAAPFAALVLRNDGGDASLDGLALQHGRKRTPLDGPLAAGAQKEVPLARTPSGNVSLVLGDLTLASLAFPPLRAGEAFRDGKVERMGVTLPETRTYRAHVRAFATPDAGAAPLVALVDGARDEILLEGYTLTSPELGAALARAAERGVRVRVLLEGAPVGGVPPEERALLSALAARGADVALMASTDAFPARFATVHAKTLVVDRERALVSTENFHASSWPAEPGEGTRGYALLVEGPDVAQAFADVFLADAGPWPDVRAPRAALGPPATMAPRPVLPGAASWEGEADVTPLFSPAPVEGHPLLARIEAARTRVDVAMLFAEPTFDEGENPFLDALLEAARRGVRVRLLLDGHVDAGRNRAVAAALAARAEGLPMEVRVDEAPRTLHAKLVVVDGQGAYVGSMNWGEASVTRNREAGAWVGSPALAEWLQKEFDKDWEERGAGRETPGLDGRVALLTLLLPLLRGRARRRRPSRT